MSRAEKAALKAYPNNCFVGVEYADMCRSFYQDGYEQAEKDTIKRVCGWLKKNATYIHPRTSKETCMINLNALREAMEKE